ncbi:hypothetical protein B9G69_002970 [Bdellovibrio sp. SKB1291214]|uniref:hypothetical protein n=1 Tax=Bdellovibrio sp. SKB1291214 TaxID=1732569 RepID=UPI000B51A5A8|nr:hypothetical protein [Bdellovibrio sp. SKB1291214]UYL09533.1 hypothetical protein B9G69_002970 [Bdellovibrio sp. SKB1291214]
MQQTSFPNENWNAVKAMVHRRWDEISDEELEATQGDEEAVIDLLAQKYHLAHEDAESRFEAALAEEDHQFHSVDEIRRSEIRFESDGGRVVPRFEDVYGDLKEMNSPSRDQH